MTAAWPTKSSCALPFGNFPIDFGSKGFRSAALCSGVTSGPSSRSSASTLNAESALSCTCDSRDDRPSNKVPYLLRTSQKPPTNRPRRTPARCEQQPSSKQLLRERRPRWITRTANRAPGRKIKLKGSPVQTISADRSGITRGFTARQPQPARTASQGLCAAPGGPFSMPGRDRTCRGGADR